LKETNEIFESLSKNIEFYWGFSQVITAPMDQPNGQAICQKMGGNLASIHDNGTHEFIGTLTRPSYDMAYQLKWPILRAFWIGKFEFRINSLLFYKKECNESQREMAVALINVNGVMGQLLCPNMPVH
jgi:hypothetical protein